MSALSTSASPPEDGAGPETVEHHGSVRAQDLSKEGLLSQLPRDGDNRPVLGGIPLSAKLGQGGMGAVYYGVHPRLHNEVAVKVLPFHLADKNPILIKRFFAEARVAAKVKSPHIVNVLDVNEDCGVFYLVMEFIDGLTASQVLRKVLAGDSVPPIDVTGPHSGVSARMPPVGAGALSEPTLVGGLPEWAALEICMGAAEGLTVAHGYDVVHRDVKPDNILVPRMLRRGANIPLDLRRSKLADLGLAKPEDSNSVGTISQLTMGTPGYMSPEQIRDAKRASKPSDVFSLGATLYALLAGRSPFSGNSVGDLLVKTITEPHEPLTKYRSDISTITRELVDHCLAKDPAERFADGAELLEALQMAAAGVAYPSGALRSMGDSRVSSGSTPRPSRVAEMLTPPPNDTAVPLAAPAAPAAEALDTFGAPGAPMAVPALATLPGMPAPATPPKADPFAPTATPNAAADAAAPAVLADPAEAISTPGLDPAVPLSTVPVQAPVLPRPAVAAPARNHTDLTPPEPLPPVQLGTQHTPMIPVQRISKQPPVVPEMADLNYSARVSRMMSRLMRAEPGQRRNPLPIVVGLLVVAGALGAAVWWFGFEAPRRESAVAYQSAMTAARSAEAQARGADNAQSEKKYWQAVLTACQTALNAQPGDNDAKAAQATATGKLDAVTLEIKRSAEIYRDAMSEAQAAIARAAQAPVLATALQEQHTAVAAYARALRARPDDAAAKSGKAGAQASLEDLTVRQRTLATALTAIASLESQAAAATDYSEKFQNLDAAAKRCLAAQQVYPEPVLRDIQARLEAQLPLMDALSKGADALLQAKRSEVPAQALALTQFAAETFGRAAAKFPADATITAAARQARDLYARAFYGGFLEVRRIDPFADQPNSDKLLGCALSPDQKSILLFASNGLVQVWTLADRKRTATLATGGATVFDAAYLTDRLVATGSGDRMACLWNLPGGDKVRTLLAEAGAAATHGGPVKIVQSSFDAKMLLTCADDKTVAVWEVETGQRLARLEGHTDWISSALFSPDGRQVLTASHDQTARLWNARTGQLVREFKGHTGKVYRAVFDPSGGRVLTVSEDRTARIWDAATGVQKVLLPGHDGAILWGEFSAHGDRVLTAANDNLARVWNAATGEAVFILKGHTGLVNRGQFCIDDTLALTTSYDGSVRLWNMLDGTPLAALAGHGGPVFSAVMTADGRSIFTAGDHTVRQWTNPLLPSTALGAPSPDDAYRLALEDARRAEQTAAQVASDPFAARAAWDEAVQGYDRALRMVPLDAEAEARRQAAQAQVKTIGEKVAARERDYDEAMARARAAAAQAATYTQNEDRKAGQAYQQWTLARDTLRRAIELKPGDPLATGLLAEAESRRRKDYYTRLSPQRTFTGHTGRVEAVAFAPDGKQVASAAEDSTVRLWNAVNGDPVFSNQGHKAWPNTLEFSLDGSVLVSADNVAVFVWDPTKGTQINSLMEPNDAGVTLSPDGKSLITLASGAAALKTWNARTLEPAAAIDLPQLAIRKFVFSPDHRIALVQLADGGLRILEGAVLKPVQTLESTDDAPVGSLAVDPRNRVALAACFDGVVRLWSVETGKLIFSLKGHRGPADFAIFSPDGALILSGGSDRTARVWDAATGVELAVLYGHPDNCYAGAFSPDSRALAIAAGSAVSLWCNPQDDTQPLCKTADAEQTYTRSLQMAAAQDKQRLEQAGRDTEAVLRATEAALAGYSTALAVHPADPAAKAGLQAARVAFLAQREQADRYDRQVADGLAQLEKAVAARSAGADATALFVKAIEAFQAALVTHPGDSRAENLIQQTRLTQEGNPFAGFAAVKTLEPFPAAITALKFLPDGRRVLVGLADGQALIQEVDTGKSRTFKDHTAAISAVDLSPDGAAFATASLDKTVRLVAVESGATVHILQVGSPVRCTAFSQTGKTLLTGSEDGITRLWDVPTGTSFKELPGHQAAVTTALISRDGNYLLTASEDKAVKIWDLLEGKVLRGCEGHAGAVLGAAFSPDGKTILSVSADHSARTWNLADGKQLRELAGHDDKVLAGAFLPSGKAIVTASADKSVRLWDTATGAPYKRFDAATGAAPAAAGAIRALAISPDGKTIAAGGDGKIIRLYADPADKTNPLLFKK